MRRLVAVGLAGGLAAAAGAWFLLVEPGQARQPLTPPAEAAAFSVGIDPVTRGVVRRELQAVGTLRSNESVILRPEITGRITEILFEEGQEVRKGGVLVRLDAAVARAQVGQARASLALSQANYERSASLLRSGAGTQRVYDETIAKLRADEAALALEQALLDKSTLVAPFDGIAGLRRVSVGDYVNPGQDLVNIENIDVLKVDFRLPEIYALQLTTGQSVRVTLDAVPGASFDGEVYAIDPAHDPNGRAVVLRARIPNSGGKLRSGMFARVSLIVDERTDAILAPETALVPIGDEQLIYRVIDNRAVLTKVKTGQRRDGQVEILEGISADAVVITEGALKLRDGSPVRSPLAAVR